ncbi:hypothetical protein [Burkholderia territorii]|uniref:hypothetical protein n=1 Tax=Burkholderia territorii TaxID=1503055 RepID=UPI0009BCBB6D|nr:hypothetical protein [Burkholderia territorii]
MNPALYTAVLVGLALVLAAMFGFGFHWLAIRDRSVLPATPTPVPASPSPAAVDENDEWEACAPYPDHVFHAPHYDDATLNDIYPSFGRHEELLHASHTADVRHDLHNAIESLTTGPSAPEPPRPATPPSATTLRCPRCLLSRIDTRTFDAEIQQPMHGRPFRPEMTAIVDIATRRAVDFSIGLAESAIAVIDALRHLYNADARWFDQPDRSHGAVGDRRKGDRAAVLGDLDVGRWHRRHARC